MYKFEFHITIETEQASVVESIAKECQINTYQLSINQIKQAVNKGALWLTRGKSTQRLRKIKKPLQLGDEIHFYYHQQVLDQKPAAAQLIEDFHHYSVWYKPYGMLSQGSKWSDHCTICRWVESHITPQRTAYLVHRLDRAASGLIMVAHSKSAAQLLSQLFEQRTIKKHYQVIVHGKFAVEDNNQVVDQAIDGKKAHSIFSMLDYHQPSDTSLLEVKIATGRKHQIRKHASLNNLPVVGDRLHGLKSYRYPDDLHLQLTAVYLAFNCPFTNSESCIELPIAHRPSLINTAKKLSNTTK